MRRIYCSTMVKTFSLIFLTILFVFITRCISLQGDRTILKTIQEVMNYESHTTNSQLEVFGESKSKTDNIIFKQVEAGSYNQLKSESIESTHFFKMPVVLENPKRNSVFLQHKIVHLDLKGAPPKIEYLESILPLMKSAGATGILIEYEDMFPFEGALQNISALNAYSKIELLRFLRGVKSIGMEIIPLVQTFGHLEFVLKLDKFRYLREMDEHADSICPTNQQSIELVHELIKQVIELHSQVQQLKWFHIGCDEVYHINKCLQCQIRDITNLNLFVDHVTNIAKHIRKEYTNVVPLIWDDMLRNRNMPSIKASGLGKLVNIVVWDYGNGTVENTLPAWIWFNYYKIFNNNIWIASAFKGAFGDTAMVPDLQRHYGNNLKWMKIATSYKTGAKAELIQFRGIFLTGWSRYSHFHVLCETLPVGIPSLILNLILTDTYTNLYLSNASFQNLHRTVSQKLTKLLGCPHFLQNEITDNFLQIESNEHIFINEYLSQNIATCTFDGKDFYEAIRALDELERAKILPLILESSFSKNGFLQYNIDHKIVGNENIFDNAFQESKNLLQLSQTIQQTMARFFDEYTVGEFMEYKIGPLMKALDKIKLAKLESKNYRIWPRRPFKHIALSNLKHVEVLSLKDKAL